MKRLVSEAEEVRQDLLVQHIGSKRQSREKQKSLSRASGKLFNRPRLRQVLNIYRRRPPKLYESSNQKEQGKIPGQNELKCIKERMGSPGGRTTVRFTVLIE